MLRLNILFTRDLLPPLRFVLTFSFCPFIIGGKISTQMSPIFTVPVHYSAFLPIFFFPLSSPGSWPLLPPSPPVHQFFPPLSLHCFLLATCSGTEDISPRFWQLVTTMSLRRHFFKLDPFSFSCFRLFSLSLRLRALKVPPTFFSGVFVVLSALSVSSSSHPLHPHPYRPPCCSYLSRAVFSGFDSSRGFMKRTSLPF